jgi:threonine/homoserine/homoserine lactone efflux protein
MLETSSVAGVAVVPRAWYSFVMGMTPGPKNLMLAASGMNFGWRRTVPHIFGVLTGFTALIFLAGVGIGTLYEAAPGFRTALRWIGASFLVYLAWRIAAASRLEHPADARPLRFVEAALFQFANPKAWVFSLTAAATFLGSGGLAGALVLTIAGMCMTIVSTTTWTLFGAGLARWIASERVQRRVNLAFAVALLATVPLMLAD